MKYVLHFGPEALHIEMEGSFTFMDSRAFHKMMSVIAANDTRGEIRLNVSKLKSMDSTALRLMMMAHDMAKKCHRGLTFEKPKGQVSEMLTKAARVNSLNIAA